MLLLPIHCAAMVLGTQLEFPQQQQQLNSFIFVATAWKLASLLGEHCSSCLPAPLTSSYLSSVFRSF
jgi:hypothetical protein